LTTLLRL